jgi:hypothetical protein
VVTLFKSRRYAQVVALRRGLEVVALLDLFTEVASEQDWQLGGRIGACTDRSLHHAVQVGGKLAGGLQMALPDGSGRLPCQAV